MRQSISLTDDERQHLQVFVHRGKANARTLTRARVLLKVDEGWTDADLVVAFDILPCNSDQYLHALHHRRAGGRLAR